MNIIHALSDYMNVHCFLNRHTVDKMALCKVLETHKPFLYGEKQELYFNSISIKCRKCRKPLCGSIWVNGLNEDKLQMYCFDDDKVSIKYAHTKS